ncbi:MAG TPA: type II toxin-antitoxin system VapC family toxin [Solirubrobacteraceae bacterium]|nr:type II toxin-antitoxin system VapC family toxin [Solirubrobacteraceae bacterium]
MERAIRGIALVAPDSINPEVVHAIRRLERSGKAASARANEMLADFLDMSIARIPTLDLMADVWNLRGNLTAYDACYVALARGLRAELITADKRLARAPNLGIPLVVV